MTDYIVTEADLIEDLEGFPIEVVQLMLERQVEQGRNCDVSVFQRCATSGGAGFVWSETEEGRDWWSRVIEFQDFDRFFERYPISAVAGVRKVKPLKSKMGVVWTPAQQWVADRVRQDKPLTNALNELTCCYEPESLVRGRFDFPILSDELEVAYALFNVSGGYEDALRRRCALANRIQNEMERMRRLLSLVYGTRKSADSIEINNFAISDEDTMRCFAISWLRKNAELANRFNYIGFIGQGIVNYVYPLSKVTHISSTYTKKDGVYTSGGFFVIGDRKYIIR